MELAHSNWVLSGGYLAVAALSLAARHRERKEAAWDDGVWPPFWSLVVGFLVVMAIGRAGGIGELIADFGRDEATSSGWYRSRHLIQAAAIGIVSLGLSAVVGVACWQTSERRRRYLPMGLAVIAIAALAAIRIVSLHQVDTLLHRTHVGGVRVGTLSEVCLLAIAASTTLWVLAHRPTRP